ncbi:MAG TPA: TonB-dependent receptor [Anaeromyxobacter sp.]
MKLRLVPSLLGIAAAALWAGAAVAEPLPDPAPSPEFWDPPVVTPSGQASRVSESPSTTFVITADEIRHSGATSVPEILRRVPGLDVRQMTATDGQLGLRGFAYEIADRILVLVDGRTVYIDFFGGTSFEMLPVSLVDIERIEVVLGPGASVYGNKAMLGTINIITRSAADYPFAEARVDAGPPRDGRVGARYGAIQGAWRLRATGLARGLTPFDADGGSPATAGGGTLSATYSPSASEEASLELGAMNGDTSIIPTGSRVDAFGATLAYLRARGRLGLGGPGSPYGDLNLDVVWNAGRIQSATFPSAGGGGFHAEFHTPYARLHHEIRTELFNVPMQARWGGEVRLNTLDSTVTTGERPLWNGAGFASNEMLLGRWRLTTGLRVDRSTLTRASISPRLSVVWSPAEHHQVRAAFNTGYNNAHLLHYFADLDIARDAATGKTVHVQGNPELRAEHAVYGEIGWNGGLTPWLRAFATAFAYRLEDWIVLDPQHLTTDASRTTIPYGNMPPSNVYGCELGVELTLLRALSAYASYAFMGPKGAGEFPYMLDAHGSPRHKVSAGLRVERMGAYVTVDAQYFGPSAVARVPDDPSRWGGNPFEQTPLDQFVMTNARVGYAYPSGLDLSLSASNALADRTRQFPGAEAPERRVAVTAAYYR